MPGVSDHVLVLARVELPTPQESSFVRKVWHYGRANWPLLRRSLRETSWQFLKRDDMNTDDMALFFRDIVMNSANQFIPSRFITNTKSTHPWINSTCLDALKERLLANHTPREADAVRRCSEVFLNERRKFEEQSRIKLLALKPGSKAWWGQTNSLMGKATKCTRIPPLKKDNVWHRSAGE